MPAAIFNDLPFQHVPLVTSKLEHFSILNARGTEDLWMNQQIFLANIFVTAGSSLKRIHLASISTWLITRINPSVEALIISQLGKSYSPSLFFNASETADTVSQSDLNRGMALLSWQEILNQTSCLKWKTCSY